MRRLIVGFFATIGFLTVLLAIGVSGAPQHLNYIGPRATVVAFNRDYKAYGECIRKYVDDNRAWVNAVVEVNNKAVEEYNKYTTELKKQIDAAKE